MNDTQLAHFLAVYDHGGYSAAAESTFASRQVLGRSITELEKEIGGKLFVRKGRGIEPTELGVQAAELARAVVKDMDTLKGLAESLVPSPGVQLHLKLAVSTHGSRGASLPPDELRDHLRRTFPDVRFTIEELTCEACPKALEAGLVDAVVTIGSITNPLFENEQLGARDAYLAVSPGSLLTRKRSLRIRDLRDIPLAQPESLSFLLPRVNELCRDEGFAPVWRYAGPDRCALRNFIEAGGGILVCRDTPFGIDTPCVCHIPFDKSARLEFPYCCVTRKSKPPVLGEQLTACLRTLIAGM